MLPESIESRGSTSRGSDSPVSAAVIEHQAPLHTLGVERYALARPYNYQLANLNIGGVDALDSVGPLLHLA